jgi:hypothetical protein
LPSRRPTPAPAPGVLGGLADVERDLIRTRTAEGRSRAQKRGQRMGAQTEIGGGAAGRGPQAACGRCHACRTRAQPRRRQEHDFPARLDFVFARAKEGRDRPNISPQPPGSLLSNLVGRVAVAEGVHISRRTGARCRGSTACQRICGSSAGYRVAAPRRAAAPPAGRGRGNRCSPPYRSNVCWTRGRVWPGPGAGRSPIHTLALPRAGNFPCVRYAAHSKARALVTALAWSVGHRRSRLSINSQRLFAMMSRGLCGGCRVF